MKDLMTLNSNANIIPITRKLKQDTPSVVSALNNLSNLWENDGQTSKAEMLSFHIYVLNLLDAKTEDSVFVLGENNLVDVSVLASLGAKVTLLTDNKFDVLQTIDTLEEEVKNNIKVVSKDQISLLAHLAPFDRILVSTGVSNLPKELYAMLAINGQMVINSMENDHPTFLQITRNDDNDFDVKKKNGLKDRSTSYEVFDL